MENVRIGAVGDGGVGKTALLISYTENEFPEGFIPRIYNEDDKEINVMVDGSHVSLELWDTIACEDYERIRLFSYTGTDVFLMCFSVSSGESLENIVSKWVPEVCLTL